MAEYDYTGRSVSWVRLTVIAGLLILLGVLIWIVFFRSSSPGPSGNIAQQSGHSHNSSGSSSSKSPGTSSTSGNGGSKTSHNTSTGSTSNENKSASSSSSSSTHSSSGTSATSGGGVTKPKAQTSQPQLVNTGPGDVAATFFAATAVGTAIYRIFLRRRHDSLS